MRSCYLSLLCDCSCWPPNRRPSISLQSNQCLLNVRLPELPPYAAGESHFSCAYFPTFRMNVVSFNCFIAFLLQRIVLISCHIQQNSFSQIQALPRMMRMMCTCSDTDLYWTSHVCEVHKTVGALESSKWRIGEKPQRLHPCFMLKFWVLSLWFWFGSN